MSSPAPAPPATPAKVSHSLSHRLFERDGFLHVPGAVDRQQLSDWTREARASYREQVSRGVLFTGGGNWSGHLNCFPGESSRFVYEQLEARGIFELVQALSSQRLRAPNVGCNFNLPGSSAQNEHVDGYAATPFLVLNVAAVDTDLDNGAMEIVPRSHRRDFKYWEIVLQQRDRARVLMKQGDALIRTSRLWHRGMPNRSPEPRPMLAFTWENGGSSLADPYAQHGGRITFLPNRFATGWRGRLKERAFVAAPRLGVVYQVARSLLEAGERVL
jgi:hypothetical protein